LSVLIIYRNTKRLRHDVLRVNAHLVVEKFAFDIHEDTFPRVNLLDLVNRLGLQVRVLHLGLAASLSSLFSCHELLVLDLFLEAPTLNHLNIRQGSRLKVRVYCHFAHLPDHVPHHAIHTDRSHRYANTMVHKAHHRTAQ
jgi:hypothetical protein